MNSKYWNILHAPVHPLSCVIESAEQCEIINSVEASGEPARKRLPLCWNVRTFLFASAQATLAKKIYTKILPLGSLSPFESFERTAAADVVKLMLPLT